MNLHDIKGTDKTRIFHQIKGIAFDVMGDPEILTKNAALVEMVERIKVHFFPDDVVNENRLAGLASLKEFLEFLAGLNKNGIDAEIHVVNVGEQKD